MSKITAGHYVNLIAPISFGAYSVLAGSGSQMWTHGFTHDTEGPGREEHKKPIRIGDNVYIGSMCCIGPGVTLGNHVAIGSHSSVAKSLSEPGLYVSQELRLVENRSNT
jgi:acetyltransferase-like isoleucine patch superfamily enzyme